MGRRLAIALIFLTMMSGVALAGADDAIIARWYDLLSRADAPGLSALLADDARIHLNDIGVDQTKAEFLESMAEWAIAVAGAAIRYRIEISAGDVTTVLACYDFASNDMLVRETFTIRDGLIVDNGQTGVAETCTLY